MATFFSLFTSSGGRCCDIDRPPAPSPQSESTGITRRIAIVGNPNCGKTTLFNALTGARQRVGNWPGVTVDRKVGAYRDRGQRIEVVDLPGVYSLTAADGDDSLDEKIARDYVLSGEADLIVNIVDATNLERNLHLTAQLIETRSPMIVALNMIDSAHELGIDIDDIDLARQVGCPVVPICAATGECIDVLKSAIWDAAGSGAAPGAHLSYGAWLDSLVDTASRAMASVAEQRGLNPRWLAVKAIEGDRIAVQIAQKSLDEALPRRIAAAEEEAGKGADHVIASARLEFAGTVAEAAIRRRSRVTRTPSDRFDRIVLHRWAGPAIFLLVVYAMFLLTINVGGAFIDFFDIAFGTIFVEAPRSLLSALGTPEWIIVLIADGVGGGVQIVATFIPIVGFLYLCLSFLEDSGYMARAAFLMDRFMRRIGLPGKSFVPLIVGFGCNVPSIMATRTLEKPRDRILTVMMAPFMSCGARLPVYALFAAAFFPIGGQNVVFALYILGILAAVGTGLLLRQTVLTGETSLFVMELPAYHMPRLRGVVTHTWHRLKAFVFGAGKVIVVVVIALTFLNSWGTDGTFGNEDTDRSGLSAIGRALVPVFEPMGITEDNWPATVGIFAGIFAKEAVVGTLDALYSGLADDGVEAGGEAEEEAGFDLLGGLAEAVKTIPANLYDAAGSVLDPLGIASATSDSLEEAAETLGATTGTFGAMVERFDGRIGAFAYLLLILLYMPCVAALAAIVREVGGRWAAFAALWTTGLAYGAAVAVYQMGTLLRDPVTSAAWIAGLTLCFAAVVLLMRHLGRVPDRSPPLPMVAE